MLIYQKGSKVSFYNALLYTVFFKMSKKFSFVTDENKIENAIGTGTYQKLKKTDLRPNLSLSTFEQRCYEVNNILMEKSVFKSL